jgi:glycosyltransferase involved in cell wall biosynthesis
VKIHGLTVSVGYAEFLARTITRWREGLASLVVVTAHGDDETVVVAQDAGATVYVTDAFTRDGAVFNKGRAMEEARAEVMPSSDWLLFFDADVRPPAAWKARVCGIKPGYLYGCRRYQGEEEDFGQHAMVGDAPGVGYFQLFHSSDPAVQTSPLLETHWTHAGNYDNAFMDRWRDRGIPIREVPFRLAHLGERGNWFGRGRSGEMAQMRAERVRRGGRWDHERIEVSP